MLIDSASEAPVFASDDACKHISLRGCAGVIHNVDHHVPDEVDALKMRAFPLHPPPIIARGQCVPCRTTPSDGLIQGHEAMRPVRANVTKARDRLREAADVKLWREMLHFFSHLKQPCAELRLVQRQARRIRKFDLLDAEQPAPAPLIPETVLEGALRVLFAELDVNRLWIAGLH
jgi:hypothetical protein